MAVFTIDIENYVGVFGVKGQSLYGLGVYGTSVYGSDTEIVLRGVSYQNDLTITQSLSELRQLSGIWFVVFVGGSTDPNQRVSTAYSSSNQVLSTYQTPSSPTTNWS